MQIAVIGAGMSGLACAKALLGAGHRVSVFDKGRSPGGRMSSRRVETGDGMLCFDHGAQYFTARDREFKNQVAEWQAAGVVAHWPAAGDGSFVGVPTMTAPVRALAEGLDVRSGERVTALEHRDGGWILAIEDGGAAARRGPFDAVVVAVPAEQAADLLAPHDAAMARLARDTRSDPCWTLMVAFDGPVPLDAEPLRNAGAIGWAARNSGKPGRSGPEAWVVQASPVWSRAHLEDDPAAVSDTLLAAFADAVPATLPGVIHTVVHRWRYAKAGKASIKAGCLWNAELRLGACGDWLIGPRVECAFVSGRRLAARIEAGG